MGFALGRFGRKKGVRGKKEIFSKVLLLPPRVWDNPMQFCEDRK